MSRLGKQTMAYDNPPSIVSHYSIAGNKEAQGPLGGWFDETFQDDLLGKDTWEQAESEMLRRCADQTAARAGKALSEIQTFFSGDLNNQIIASGFCARSLDVPFMGLYGACSTFVQGIVLASALISGGCLDNALCAASSHFCTAERQYRFPLELGTQRTMSAQWTATAAGCVCLASDKIKGKPRVTCGTVGKVVDYKVKDANNMGAAMAPAVFSTINAHFADTSRQFDYYDYVFTGDLGQVGRDILLEMLFDAGMKIDETRLIDCGATLFSPEQDAHAGGSGCGCVASVSSGWILKRMEAGEFNRALIVGSGAMLSPTSGMQGESIPSISYLAAVEV